jgi:hypothetical protein
LLDRDSVWWKYMPIDNLITILGSLPSDCLYITSNSVGNLSVLDENHNMIGYIDLCFEQFIELT